MRERRHGFRYYASLMSLAGGLLTLAMLISCGGNGPQTTPSLSGTVTTSISDPPTCQAPSGPFSNVWVTITKVGGRRAAAYPGRSDSTPSSVRSLRPPTRSLDASMSEYPWAE